MSQRDRFRQFMACKGDSEPLPFPIYKTAFVASALGREWATDVTHEECRDVMLNLGCVPSVTLGEKEWFPQGHPLCLAPVLRDEVDDRREYTASVATPYGVMEIKLAEFKRQSLSLVRGPVEKEADFGKVLWYIREVRKHTDAIRDQVRSVRDRLGEDCLIVFFLPQPYELYCIFNREESLFLEIDQPAMFAELQAEILDTVKAAITPAVEGGADLFFFGSAGTELYSPDIFTTHLLGPSMEFAELVREVGSYSTFHLCGRGREYLDLGVFEKIRVDIVEGLGLDPTGNLPSLGYAKARIPEAMVLRGNMNLGLLRNGTAAEVYGEAKRILADSRGTRHILSGECDLLFGTPPENIKALFAACQGQ